MGHGTSGCRGAAWVGAALLLAAWAPAGADEAASGASPDAAARTEVKSSGFFFKEIPVDAGSARTGRGESVSLGGHAVALQGRKVQVGDVLRPATLRDRTGKDVAIDAGSGRIRILSVVPALQTRTCEQQTHYLSEKSGDLGERAELVTISVDPPEVQDEFAREAGIGNVTFLSDTDSAAFGRAHGLLLEEPPLLARAVLVVDGENVVRYLQVVPEVSHMPDMEAAFGFARGLLEDAPSG